MKQLQTKRTNTVKIKRKFFMVAVVFCAAGIALTSCNNPTNSDDTDKPVVEDNDNTNEDTPPSNDGNNGNQQDDPSDSTNEETPTQSDETGSNITVPVTNPSQPTVTNPQYPSKDASLSIYWTKLDGCVKAGQNYYSEYYTKTRVITKNGYLYNYSASTQITVDYLVNEEMLDSKYASSDISLVLMYGSDIANNGGSNIHMSGTDKNELTVFAFMKHPSENKYIFTSANGSYGTISDSSYNTIMSKYSTNNGTVQRLTPSSSEYDRILSCIRMYESKYEQYFVRSITIDNKYAFVVLSGRANAATIREYILEYDNGIWEVVMDDLELESRLPVVVNKKLPDFNTSLLPKYSLRDYRSSMLTDYTDIMDALTKAGYYAKDDTFYYFCGTTDYCYMITDNGKRFLCNKNGSEWNCYKVLDYYDALSRLQSWSNNPPTFILLDLE